MQQIFISYSRHDSNITLDLAERLRAEGHNVWTDVGGIPGGAVWLYEIERAITDCDVLVVVISRSAKESPWVRREILFALDLSKRIIPVRIEDITLPFALYELQPIDHFRDSVSAYAALCALLGGPLSRPAHTPTPAAPAPTRTDGMSLVAFHRHLLAQHAEDQER